MTVIDDQTGTYKGYRVKIQYSLQMEERFWRSNEFVFPKTFASIGEAQKKIKQDIRERLDNSYFFRSYIHGYELVHYSQMASRNTYISYKIIPARAREKPASGGKFIRDLFGQS